MMVDLVLAAAAYESLVGLVHIQDPSIMLLDKFLMGKPADLVVVKHHAILTVSNFCETLETTFQLRKKLSTTFGRNHCHF